MNRIAYGVLAFTVALIALPNGTHAATTTLDNLQTGLSGESNAHLRYLAFAFNYAKTAEAEHAKLYSESLNNLPKLKRFKSKGLFRAQSMWAHDIAPGFFECQSCFTHKNNTKKVSQQPAVERASRSWD